MPLTGKILSTSMWAGPMLNVMAALPNIAGALCSTMEMQDAKKSPKIRHLGTIAQFVGKNLNLSLQTRNVGQCPT